MNPIFDLVRGVVSPILDKIIPDVNARAAAQAELAKMALQGDLDQLAGQLAINKDEAQSRSVFVAGWRPSIGWTCALALFYQYVAGPLIEYGALLFGKTLPPLPKLDDVLWQLLFGMLGMGGLRTIEKIKGASK